MMNQASMAQRIVATLSAHNARFALSPGSRNTPLVLHLPEENHPVVHDERSLGFFGVGLSRTGQLPVLMTTSGTAVANLLPAIVEAKQDQLPFIALTADRPESDYGRGANQTIQQTNIFGHHVVAAFSFDAHTDSETDVDRKLREALDAVKNGPVHLNVHLRKPLEEVVERKTISPPTPTQKDDTSDIPVDTYDLILVGQCDRAEAIAAAQYGRAHQIEMFFDIQSGSLGHGTINLSELVHAGNLPTFNHALVVGSRFTEHRVWKFLQEHVSTVTQVSQKTGTFDPLGVVDHHYTHSMTPHPHLFENAPLVFEQMDEDTPLLHRQIVASTLKTLVENRTCQNIFIGNSLVIRAFDRFRPSGVWFGPNVFANRGASGIDGNLATAAGIATSGSTLCIVGDQTFLHDIGSLVSFRRSPMRIVVVDNQGGRIFEHLPTLPSNDLQKYFVNRAENITELSAPFTNHRSDCDSVREFVAQLQSQISMFEIVVAHVDPVKDLIDFRGVK